MTPYSKKALEHFKNPKNFGKIKNPDGIGEVGNIICGDVMKLYIKIKKDIITDIKFQTYGCLAAIASSSAITEMIKGKTIKQALNLNRQKIVDNLGGLPAVKIHCSVLAVDALLEAIHDYLAKNKFPIPADLSKKHRQIEEEKKTVEKRYKNWTNLEKKLAN